MQLKEEEGVKERGGRERRIARAAQKNEGESWKEATTGGAEYGGGKEERKELERGPPREERESVRNEMSGDWRREEEIER
jgi:hypothetical protein